jgi:hypothetical protein
MLLPVIGLVAACNNPQKKADDGFKFEDEVKQTDIEITKSFIYLFPSPGEILDRFQEARLMFNPEVLHDPGAEDEYITSKDKALNLGVYLTDLAYASLFDRSSASVDFLDAIQNLSTDLNISSSVFEPLIDRARNNMSNRDSLVSISNEVFYNMIDFLENSGQENTVALVSCGAYVESMFIALSSVEAYNENDPIIRQVAELKYPMENLLSHAESVSDDPNVQSILTYIRQLDEVFSELEAQSSKATVSEPGVITFSGGSAPDLTEDNFDAMKEKVVSIRGLIIAKTS